MSDTSTRTAVAEEINWINEKYAQVHFQPSQYENEMIIIAERDQNPVGLGRLVLLEDNHVELGGIYVFPAYRGLGIAATIVQSLLNENPFSTAKLWCLPFENLLPFYKRFGFVEIDPSQAPVALQTKMKWCNNQPKYTHKARILIYQN